MEIAALGTTRPIPTHPGLPLLGNTVDFVRDSLAFLRVLQARGERVIKLTLGGRTQYLVFQPEDAKQILQENNRNYGRAPAFLVLKLFLGEGLLTSEGDFWLRQRRLAQPAFHRQKLTGLAETMIDEAVRWVEQVRATTVADKSVNVSQSFMDVTMRIVCRTLFSTDVQGHQLTGLSHALESLNYLANKRIVGPIRFPLWLPTPDRRRFLREAALVDTLIYGFIDQRRTGQTAHDDLLDMLLNAEDEETGERMSDRQLRDECVTLFAAGHETSAVAMGWIVYLLAQHPDVVARLRQEVTQSLGETGVPTVENLRSLPYTTRVIQESMRLYPPAWVLSRRALADDQFREYIIPARATVLLSPYLLHRHPGHWSNPDQFDPDRFLPEKIKGRHPYAYLPFGAGPRLCIGNQFALMEMQILLALFVQNFDVAMPPNYRAATRPLITLRPKKDIRLLITAL